MPALAGATRDVVARRGWEVVRLRGERVEVELVPAKGGDIVALRWLPLDLDVLWHTPWGLPHRGAAAAAGDSASAFIDAYPGGWQTLFPNGGDACVDDGVEMPFHGEAATAGWDWEPCGDGVRLSTHLRRTPFALQRTLRLDGDRLEVEETAVNTGRRPVEAMWSHHPAFGAPFLGAACTIEVDAAEVLVDADRDTPASDLQRGGRSCWPFVPGRDGVLRDLRLVPPDGPPCDRLAYLAGFRRGRTTITNHELDLAAELSWDAELFPYAWYWVEARATAGPPWHGQAYVLAVEPASSIPGHGIAGVRASGGRLLRFDPGVPRTLRIAVTLRPASDGPEAPGP